MTAPSTVRTPAGPAGNGARRGLPVPPGRRVRLPELAVGVLVTVGFALGAVLWHLRSVDRIAVLVVATDVARGEVLEPRDVRVAYLGADDAVARLSEADIPTVVGLAARLDLGEGTLLTRDLLDPELSLAPGEGVVGLALEAGQFPAGGLSPGDRVNVVARAAESGEAIGEEAVPARGARVFAVEDLGSDRLLVSILLSEEDAITVAAAADGSLRLVLVAP